MKKTFWTGIALSALLVPGVISCQETKRGEYAKGNATIFCDEGFKNILDEEIEVFEYSYPGASIIPFYVSETEAIDTLLSDQTEAIICTQELTKDQIKYMKNKYKRVVRQKCIAVDAVALIVNKNNPIEQLSMTEIKEILNGQTERWSQLAGADTTKIQLVFDNNGSSTVSYLREKFLDNKSNISDHAYATAVKNNAQVFDYVKKDPNAIGVISVSWLGDNLEKAKKVPIDKRMEEYQVEGDTISTTLTSEVKILKVSNPTEENDFSAIGYKPYQAYLFTGEYPLVRKVFMISIAPNSTLMHSFYSFVTGFVGQKIMMNTGILPYEIPKRTVNLIDTSSK